MLIVCRGSIFCARFKSNKTYTMSSIATYVGNERLKGGDVNSVMITYGAKNQEKIQNLRCDIVSCKFLYVDREGSVDFAAPFVGDITLAAGKRIFLNDGTTGEPSLTFANAPTTGISLSGGSSINVSIAGVQTSQFTNAGLTTDSLTTQTITTTSGDLSLNPSGPNIDFNGKNLLNVGTITLNPYVYDVISIPNITSSSLTVFSILTIGTMTNQTQLIKLRIVGANATTNQVYTYNASIRVKNLSGTVSSILYDITRSFESSLSAVVVSLSTSGSNLLIRVAPGTTNTIKWVAVANLVVQSF